MARWTFEPGHTAAEFCVRHMMVTYIRGHIKNVRGTLTFDPADPQGSSVEATLEAAGLWSGEPDRDAHVRADDFLDVERHPLLAFRSSHVEVQGENDYLVTGGLTLRGITREVTLSVRYLGQWQTPWWEGGVDRGPKTRAGFLARTTLNRRDFGVNWQAELEKGGVVVGDAVEITIDVEAILSSE